MNAKHLSLVLFLTLVAGVATAAIKHGELGSPKGALIVQNTDSAIPRVVVTAKRQQDNAEDCETTIPRIVVVGRRIDAGQVAAAR